MQVIINQPDKSIVQQMLYKNWILYTVIAASVAILGVVIMAIVFPTYYYSLFHFNRKYSSLIQQANDAMTDTGVIQTYLNECITLTTNNSAVLPGWCDNVVKNIKPLNVQYQTTKEQQKLQLQKVLLQNKNLINNVFYCDSLAESEEEVEEPVYCVCNYVSTADTADTTKTTKYTKSDIDLTPELTKFCKQDVSKATIIDKKLESKINKFIEN